MTGDSPEMEAARTAHLSDAEIAYARRCFGVDRAAISGPPDGLLVGECPGPNTSGRLPLFPYPAGSSGGRLLKWSGLAPGEFLGRLARRNLYDLHVPPQLWDENDARVHAGEISAWLAEQGGGYRILLLGCRVGSAFELEPWGACTRRIGAFGVEIRCIPHPSGHNVGYNDPRARLAAQGAVLWAAGML